jgi:hypothetical protein
LRSALVVFLILAGVITARSQGFDPSDIETGNGFERLCSVVEKIGTSNFQPSDNDLAMLGHCTGYVKGIKDGVSLAMGAASVTAPGSLQIMSFCTPDGATHGQLVKVVLKYIRDNPDKEHLLTALLITEAFHKSFPCSDSSIPAKKRK